MCKFYSIHVVFMYTLNANRIHKRKV
uniref:Uncharacterized protein n=1 Tax=Anguilla anguilla TaxID=7936 RepID=A0A0E9P8T1_ANGAN